MRRRWIIDTSNVMGSRPDGWWRNRPAALHRLLDEIARWQEVAGEPVLAVADGYPSPLVPEGTVDGVHVRYAHSTGRDAADDEIVRIAEGHEEPGSLTIVTSDRALRERVEAAGAQSVGAGTFLDLIADIAPRRSDRSVLRRFGIDEADLLGRGGEARVYALDDDRVLRLPHPRTSAAHLDGRRALLAALRGASAPFAVPEVIEHLEVEGRTVVIERRLPGRHAATSLADRESDREALVRSHLDATLRISDLPCPISHFGELWGDGAIAADSFAAWATSRLQASLQHADGAFDHVDPVRLTGDLVDALDEPEPARPVLVHLDAFLGNMLATDSTITSVLDFGPTTIGGPRHLDAVVAVAYLAPEITPNAGDGDRAVARRWADEHDLTDLLVPAERWIAAYWTGALDDGRLRRWCRRVLGHR